MSLIIMTDGLPPKLGGIERYTYELARALQQRHEQLVVITTDLPGGQVYDPASPMPILRVGAQDRTEQVRALSTAALDCIRDGKLGQPATALIAMKWRPSGLAARTVSHRTGIPFVLMAHNPDVARCGHNPVKWLTQRRIVRSAAGGLAVSRYVANCLRRRGLPEGRIAVVYGGVNLETFAVDGDNTARLRFDLPDNGCPVLLTASRLVASKGHSQVIAALPRVVESFGDVMYMIAGAGPEEQNLRSLVEKHHVTRSVRFLGAIDHHRMPALYRAADLFIMTSRELPVGNQESLALVYLEASYCGLPVVGSDTGGCPEAILDGQTGLLVDPENPRQIADAIVRLLADKDLASRLGAAGQKRVLHQFTWDRVAERVQEALCRWALL